jgi:hypothetical protein
MTVTVTHGKVDTIADWTQADLDAEIALGNYPPGTLLADIVLPSDWNDDHTLVGIDIIERNIRDSVLIDMAGADYTLTDIEAQSPVKVFINTGDGTKTAFIPDAFLSTVPSVNSIVTGFSTSNFYIGYVSIGVPTFISAPTLDIVAIAGGIFISDYSSTVSNDAYDSSWDGSLQSPTKNAVYDALQFRTYSGISSALDFGSGGYSTSVVVANASIAANDYVQCSLMSGSTMTAEEAAIQSITCAAVVTAGVGYTIHAAAPNGASGIINVLSNLVRI